MGKGAVSVVVFVLGCVALGAPVHAGTQSGRRMAAQASRNKERSALLATALQHALESTLAATPQFPGMLLHVDAPRLSFSWSGAAGLADRATGRLLTPNDEVRIASVTKTFTAAAALRLVERNQLSLDTPITRYLPSTYAKLLVSGGYDPERITVRQLLRQTSGLADYADTDAFDDAVRAHPSHRWTRLEQVRFALDHGKPVAAPGLVYHYSDTGYILLGEVIERVSRQTLAAAYHQTLRFRALGLDHTYLETLEPEPANRPPRAHQYYAGLDLNQVDASFDLYGGGGLVSTMDDLSRFYRALLRGHVFTRRSTLRKMLSIPATNVDDADDASPGDGYGMGIYQLTAEGVVCWGHDGAWGTFAFHCPALDLTIAGSNNQGDIDIDERAFLVKIIRLIKASGKSQSRP